MKVLALTRTSSIGPSTRYRIEQYRPLLAERGIEVDTLPLFDERWFAIDGSLHIVAHRATAAARGRHRTGVGIGQ